VVICTKIAGNVVYCVVENCCIQFSATSVWHIPSEYGQFGDVLCIKMLMVCSAIYTIKKLVRRLCYFTGLYAEA